MERRAPGDRQTPHPRMQCTRAITIDTTPEQVWPWLVQMGIHRAGFYTHDRVERLLFRARYVEGRHRAPRHASAPDASPLPRLIGFAVRHVPGADLLARGFDFSISDPLHHYMDTGVLKGIKKRAEGAIAHAADTVGTERQPNRPPAATVEPLAARQHAER